MGFLSSINPITGYGFDAANVAGLLDNTADRLRSVFRQDAEAVSTPISPASAKVVFEPDVASGGEGRFLSSPPVLSPDARDWTKMRQDGPMGFLDCQVISAAAALAQADPAAAAAFVKRVKAPYLSKRKGSADRSDFVYGDTMVEVAFKRGTVRITPRMYYRSKTKDRLVHSFDADAPSEATWIALVEKAYAAEWGNEYDAIADHGPGSLRVDRVCFDMWGPLDSMTDEGGAGPLSDRILVALGINENLDAVANTRYSEQLLEDYCDRADKRPTVATTPFFGNSAPPLANDFIGQHTYVVLGLKNGSQIEVWEPMGNTKREIGKSDFFEVFDGFFQRSRP